MEKERVVSYQRISKGENVEQSLEKQKAIIEKYAKENGIEFAENYVDIHKSTTEDRPAYNRLIKDIFEGNIDKLVVIGRTNRLTRNFNVLNDILDKIYTECMCGEKFYRMLDSRKLFE